MADHDELDEVIDALPSAVLGWQIMDRARAIRDRERRLAELAHEIAHMRTDEHTYEKMKDWNRRYEEACK